MRCTCRQKLRSWLCITDKPAYSETTRAGRPGYSTFLDGIFSWRREALGSTSFCSFASRRNPSRASTTPFYHRQGDGTPRTGSVRLAWLKGNPPGRLLWTWEWSLGRYLASQSRRPSSKWAMDLGRPVEGQLASRRSRWVRTSEATGTLGARSSVWWHSWPNHLGFRQLRCLPRCLRDFDWQL